MRGVLISVCSFALLFGAACKGGDDNPSGIDAGGIDGPTGIDAPVVNAHLALSRDHADLDRKSTRLNSSHGKLSRMPSSA